MIPGVERLAIAGKVDSSFLDKKYHELPPLTDEGWGLKDGMETVASAYRLYRLPLRLGFVFEV